MYEKLIEIMEELGYNSHMIRLVKERIIELQERGVLSVEKFVQKLLDRLTDREDYLDILMEGRFAIILARNTFSNIHIEYCERGPDLKADWNSNTVYFEVTRKRPRGDEWAEQSEAAFISAVPIENTIRKIEGKIPQLKIGEINIIVFWSDTRELGPHELEEAFNRIRHKIDHSTEEYKDLSGILFTEGGGVDMATLKQFYLFKNDNASKPVGIRLTKKLESLREKDFRRLQREWEEIADALSRLRVSNN